MADPQSLWRSRRLRGERFEVEPREPSFRLTPLRCFYPLSFTFDRETRYLEQPTKRHQVELLSVEEESDLFGDDQIKYLPSNFPFAIYQTPLSPSPKR